MGRIVFLGPLAALAVIIASLSVPQVAFAVQGLGISPTSQELNLKPGQTYSGILTIINDGGEDLTYTLGANEYRIKDAEYHPDFTISGDPASISPLSWFRLPQGNTVVRAHQEAEVGYKVIVPTNATLGGHYGVIFAQTIPPSVSGGTVISRIVRVGSIFYMSVGGDLYEQGSTVAPVLNWLQMEPPFPTSLKVKNSGTVHFAVNGSVQAKSLFGAASTPAYFKGEVLPQTTRPFSVEIPARQPLGIYKVTYKLNYLGKDQIPIVRWVLLVPKLTVFIIVTTMILIIGYFLLKLVNYLFHRNKA